MSSFVMMFMSVYNLNGIILHKMASLRRLMRSHDVTNRRWMTSHYAHSHWMTSLCITASLNVTHRQWMTSHTSLTRTKWQNVTSLTGTEWWLGRRRSQWRFSACPAGESDPRCCRVDLQTSQCSEEPSHHDYRPATHIHDYYLYIQYF